LVSSSNDNNEHGRRKNGLGPGFWDIPKIWGFPFNVSATVKAIDFKISKQLWFAKADHKIPPGEKVGVTRHRFLIWLLQIILG